MKSSHPRITFYLLCAIIVGSPCLADRCINAEQMERVADHPWCDPSIIQAMRHSWSLTANGGSKHEAGFLIKFLPNNCTFAVTDLGLSQGADSLDFRGPVRELRGGWFHVHPNDQGPRPSSQDIAIANKYNFAIYTMTEVGLFEYNPETRKTTLLRPSRTWLEDCQPTPTLQAGLPLSQTSATLDGELTR